MKRDNEFHKHLDECEQCEKHPFDLCPTGKRLLQQEVDRLSEELSENHKILTALLDYKN